MATGWRRYIRLNIRRFGIDVSGYRPLADPDYRRCRLLRTYGIKTVLDVGACVGDYGLILRRNGYTGAIVSLEPLPEAFNRLANRAKSDRRWTVINEAAGETPGESVINVAANLESSSFLPMLDAHRRVAPNVPYIRTQKVSVTTLDTVLSQLEDPTPIYVKIDVQGFESQVMAGGPRTLQLASGVELELSLRHLYEGDKRLDEMLDLMQRSGFEMVSLNPGFADPETGSVLQCDGIFFRQ